MSMHMSAIYDYEKGMVFGGTCDGRTGGGCEWIKNESELPSTCMVLSLCVWAVAAPPIMFYIKVSL